MKNNRIAMAVTTALVMFSPLFAYAAGFKTLVPSDCNGQGGCQSICDIATLANNILNDGIYLTIVTSAFLFALAGWKYITAGGDMGKAKAARSLFTNVLIGEIIVLIGWLAVDTLMRTLLGTGGLPWNQLC